MKTKLVWLSTIGLVILLAGFGLAELSRNHKFQFFGELVYRAKTDEKVVALTFDDGPTPLRTQQILKILHRENVQATFYLNGKSIAKNPLETKRIVEAGHEIGNHSYSHKRMVLMSYDEVAREIEDTTQQIREIGYQGPIRFRPPFGKKLFMLPYYLAKQNIMTITWDVETETFNPGQDTPDKIYRRAIEQTQPGSIILLHVMYGDGSSLKAVPRIIQTLKADGYRFATVEQLLSLNSN